MKLTNEDAMSMSDRRYALRQPSKVDKLMLDYGGPQLIEVGVIDISRQGLKLMTSAAIPCGSEIIIHPPAETDLLKLRATIVRQKLVMVNDEKQIECGVEVADTAAWRKHAWFLTLRTDAPEDADFEESDPSVAA